MTDDDLRRFLALMDEHDLEEMEVEREGQRVRLRKRPGPGTARAAAPGAGPSSAREDGPAPPTGGEPAPDQASRLRVIRSPIVGTVYRSPEPDSAPFVEVGSRVRKGQVVCLIEAMKLMHEIDAEGDGTVAAIFVDSGQAVEYGDRLLALDPA